MGEDSTAERRITLRAGEALLEDVDTGTVRIAPADMGRLGAVAGSGIAILGARIQTAGVASPQPFKVKYEDIGGLEDVLIRVRELVELPMRYPEAFAHLRIDPPKGVLLYGPPGTGKTLIARGVASEVEAHFIHVNGPEIIHKSYGKC